MIGFYSWLVLIIDYLRFMDRLLHTADMDTDIKLYFGIVDSFDEKQNQAGFAFDYGFSKNISKMGAHGIIRDM